MSSNENTPPTEKTTVTNPVQDPDQPAKVTADRASNDTATTPTRADDAPYSIFTTKEKWIVVALTSYAALFRCASSTTCLRLFLIPG
jgi:hypothetical protein